MEACPAAVKDTPDQDGKGEEKKEQEAEAVQVCHSPGDDKEAEDAETDRQQEERVVNHERGDEKEEEREDLQQRVTPVDDGLTVEVQGERHGGGG